MLAIVAISAVSGLRRGAALQLFSYGGFWGGLLLGAVLTPVVATHIHSTTGKAVVAIVLVLGFAFVLGTVGSVIGLHSGAALRRVKLGPVDSGLGVGVAVIATLLVVWLAGSLIGASSFTSLASAMQKSRDRAGSRQRAARNPPRYSRRSRPSSAKRASRSSSAGSRPRSPDSCPCPARLR